MARLRGYRFKAAWVTLSFGSGPHWVKVKNPKALAVKRVAEEDWGTKPGLLYVTGGAAWTDVKYTGSTTVVTSSGILPASFSTTLSGPVVGGGYEWMITPNWTVRAEYLHYWFDKAQTAAITSGPLTATYNWSRFDVNVARLGLNYKF